MSREITNDHEMKVGEHFTLKEFLVSSSNPEIMKTVVLAPWEILKLHYLCKWVLDPVRNTFGLVVITSGFRPLLLNQTVGGVVDSQHPYAEAADFVVAGANGYNVFDHITKTLKFPGEVILYVGEKGDKETYRFHVGLPHPYIKADHFIKRAA